MPNWIACVGIDAYRNIAPDLRGCASGAKALHAHLAESDRAALLVSELDAPPISTVTRQAIETAVSDLVAATALAGGTDHTLTLFLAGHGYNVGFYPCLRTNHGVDPAADNLVPVTALASAAANAGRYRRVLLFSDCCRVTHAQVPDLVKQSTAVPGSRPWVFLTTQPGALAFEAAKEPTNGWATEALMEALHGAAAPADGGPTTLRHLYTWLAARVLYRSGGAQEVDLGLEVRDEDWDDVIVPDRPNLPRDPTADRDAFFEAMVRSGSMWDPQHNAASVDATRRRHLDRQLAATPAAPTLIRLAIDWICVTASEVTLEVRDEDDTILAGPELVTTTPWAVDVPVGLLRIRGNNSDVGERVILTQPGSPVPVVQITVGRPQP